MDMRIIIDKAMGFFRDDEFSPLKNNFEAQDRLENFLADLDASDEEIDDWVDLDQLVEAVEKNETDDIFVGVSDNPQQLYFQTFSLMNQGLEDEDLGGSYSNYYGEFEAYQDYRTTMIASSVGATIVEEQGKFGLKIGERVVLPAKFDTRPTLNLVGDELVASARHACNPSFPDVVTVSLEDSLNVYRKCGFDLNQSSRKNNRRYLGIDYLGDGFYRTAAGHFGMVYGYIYTAYGILKDGQEILPPHSSMIEVITLASGKAAIISYHYPPTQMEFDYDGDREKPVQVQVFWSNGEIRTSFEKMRDEPIRIKGDSLVYRNLQNQEIYIPF